MKTALAIYKLKIDTPVNIIRHRINKIIFGKEKADKIKYINQFNFLKKKYLKKGFWNFNGIILPDNTQDTSASSMYSIYLDSLFVYCVHRDNYDYTLVDKLDDFLPEGTYCYKNKEIDVTIKENDIIIDAGAWIGDFSAYAAKKGAIVYAFEPCKKTYDYLTKTKELNRNIHVFNKALGSVSGLAYLENNGNNSNANKITENKDNSEIIELTTIDEFVENLSLSKVDFIKADIEGFERKMLEGAQKTLKIYKPKLAICTYHVKDDPEVLKKIILDINPNYTIVQKSKKLYAM